MENSCKVCGGKHLNGRCTERKKEADILIAQIDRQLLRTIFEEVSKPGVLFAHKGGPELDDSKCRQLEVIAQIVGIYSESMKESSEWQELQQIIKEASGVGALPPYLSKNQDGAPGWLINGGEGAKITRIPGTGNGDQISVPGRLYRAYILDRDREWIETHAHSAPEQLKGRKTESLVGPLQRISDFFKRNNVLP